MAASNPFADPAIVVGQQTPVALNLNSNNPFRDSVGHQPVSKNPFREADIGGGLQATKREAFSPLIDQITPEKNITYDTPEKYSAAGNTNGSDKARSRYRKKTLSRSSRSSSERSSPKAGGKSTPTLFDKIEAMQMDGSAVPAYSYGHRHMHRLEDPRRLSMESRPLSIPDYELSHPRYQEQELKAIFGPGASARAVEFDFKGVSKPKKYDPLSPAPEQFAQMPRLVDEAVAFRTVVMYALDADLSKGFPNCFPLCLMSHSITLKDWKRFVEDVCCSYKIRGGPDSDDQDPPATTIRRTKTLLRQIKPSKPSIKRNARPSEGSLVHAQDLVAKWNTHFFNSRKVHVALQSPKEVDNYSTYVSREHHPSSSSHSKWYQKSSDKPRLLIFSL